MPLDGHRQTQLGRQARRHPRQARQVAVGIEQHGKLIAGQARDGVCLRQRIDQAPGHFLQQLVGDFMTQAVVEQLEAIQIDVQQRQAAITALAHPLMSFAAAVRGTSSDWPGR